MKSGAIHKRSTSLKPIFMSAGRGLSFDIVKVSRLDKAAEDPFISQLHIKKALRTKTIPINPTPISYAQE